MIQRFCKPHAPNLGNFVSISDYHNVFLFCTSVKTTSVKLSTLEVGKKPINHPQPITTEWVPQSLCAIQQQQPWWIICTTTRLIFINIFKLAPPLTNYLFFSASSILWTLPSLHFIACCYKFSMSLQLSTYSTFSMYFPREKKDYLENRPLREGNAFAFLHPAP